MELERHQRMNTSEPRNAERREDRTWENRRARGRDSSRYWKQGHMDVRDLDW